MTYKTAQQLWTEYQKYVMHPESPAIQVREMHNAFMAGFLTMFMIIERLGEPDVSEKTGFDYLTQLKNELELYVRNKVS